MHSLGSIFKLQAHPTLIRMFLTVENMETSSHCSTSALGPPNKTGVSSLPSGNSSKQCFTCETMGDTSTVIQNGGYTSELNQTTVIE